jgi:pimeloyl-ACP methyl ester carboxylesterase
MSRLLAICLLVALSACASTPADETALKRLQVGDTTLAYVEAGRGEPLILIHGGLQDYRLWQPAFATLEGYRVIAYSRRNHFPNALDRQGVPTAAAQVHADDLAAFLDGLGIDRAHIVAHSAGAYAALLFAADHPERVLSLVVNEPPATPLMPQSGEAADVARAFASRLEASRAAFREGRDEDGLRAFSDAVGGDGAYERRGPLSRAMMNDNVASTAADAAWTGPRPQFSCDAARRIGAPTLITRGERSPAFFQRIADQLADCLPDQRTVVIAGASHSVPAEQPAAFLAAVREFLAEVGRKGDLRRP